MSAHTAPRSVGGVGKSNDRYAHDLTLGLRGPYLITWEVTRKFIGRNGGRVYACVVRKPHPNKGQTLGRVIVIPRCPRFLNSHPPSPHLLLVSMVEMVTEEAKLLGEALSTVKIQVQQMKRHLVCPPICTITLPLGLPCRDDC